MMEQDEQFSLAVGTTLFVGCILVIAFFLFGFAIGSTIGFIRGENKALHTAVKSLALPSAIQNTFKEDN